MRSIRKSLLVEELVKDNALNLRHKPETKFTTLVSKYIPLSLQDNIHYSKSGVRVITMCFGVTDTPIIRNTAKVFDKSLTAQSLDKFKLQSPKSAAKAVIEAYKQGASGSVWISTSDKPAFNITNVHNKSIELFNDYVYN
ncbi:uncharacterized protein LOC120624553 isoform X3 [Pararge aegeria]|uniref:uncharacterized protein LOC120624553 isoform X3 n=1 Tax=Pararge aegeria TaxID=116150 RepID=UPI0019D0D1C1|nr:uncharacterized protein LOC120624553 isoform X3 [Pararge aegeria]